MCEWLCVVPYWSCTARVRECTAGRVRDVGGGLCLHEPLTRRLGTSVYWCVYSYLDSMRSKEPSDAGSEGPQGIRPAADEPPLS